MSLPRTRKALAAFGADECGATLVEYLFVVAMMLAVAVAVIASKQVFDSARARAEAVLTSDQP